MNHEIGKGVLEILFGELLMELPPEALTRIAQKVSDYLKIQEDIKNSHVRKLLKIKELENDAEIAQSKGHGFQAMALQMEAEDIRFDL